MSIEDRLREGLDANTGHLRPHIDHELSALLRRAHRRHRTRAAGAGLLAAAVIAGVAWLAGSTGALRSDDAPDPADDRLRITDARPMAGIDGDLAPGSYAMVFIGDGDDSLPRAVVDVPTGYVTHGGYVIETDEDPYATRTVAFWLVDKVVVDPCRHYPLVDPGPTVADLATALVDQPGHQSTTPRPVALGGYDGLYLELTVPRDAALDACTEDSRNLWLSNDPYPHVEPAPGTVDRVWILDVDGLRMVVSATSTPRVTAAQVDEMVAIAESTRFTGPANP